MSRWPTQKLGEIAAIQMGQSPPGESYNTNGEGIPFFQGKAEFGEEHPTQVKWCNQPLRIAEAGDILLSVRAPVGPTNFAAERCCIGRGLAAICSKPEIANQRYIRYYLKRFETEISARGVGSTFAAINRNDIERLELPVPPLPEQERIVKLLDEADTLRKLRAQADKRTTEFIPALFEEMFGGNNFPITTLGEIGGNGQYGLNAAAMTEGNGVRFIRITDIDERGKLGRCAPAFVPNNLPDLDHYELLEEDILIARSGATAGKVYLHRPIPERSVFAGYLIRFRIDPKKALPAYVFGFLQSKEYWTQLNSHKHAVAQPNVNAKQLSSLHFPLPPIQLQRRFAERAAEIQAMEAEQAESKERLDALFQSMLHRAFEGEM